MNDLIFIATEECLMPQLMKIISACEKTHRTRFYSKFHQEREGIKEDGGRVEPLFILGPLFIGVDLP